AGRGGVAGWVGVGAGSLARGVAGPRRPGVVIRVVVCVCGVGGGAAGGRGGRGVSIRGVRRVRCGPPSRGGGLCGGGRGRRGRGWLGGWVLRWPSGSGDARRTLLCRG